MRAIFALVALAACDPVWSLEVEVTGENGEPLEGAVVALVDCPRQNQHDLGTVAALTDLDGRASVGGLGTEYPETCAITIARPGFKSFESSFLALCMGDVDGCYRSRQIDVVLGAIAGDRVP